MSRDPHDVEGRRLPPLNALRAFEAAGRRLSLSRAADELSVTPGAVSQQIRLLEAHAGGPLLRRDGRHIALTPLGAELLPLVREGFERLEKAADLVYRPQTRRPLTVSVPPSFAAKWLVPRMSRFAAERPEIEVWISADMALSDVGGGRVDVAVRYGRGDYPGVKAQRLLDGAVTPICSPALMVGPNALRRAEDLAAHTLIHVRPAGIEETRPDWAMWLRAHGQPTADEIPGPRFDQTAFAIEAAIHGRGVALAPLAFIERDIRDGRLVSPFADGLMQTPLAYHVVTRRSGVGADAADFVRWLIREAAETSASGGEL